LNVLVDGIGAGMGWLDWTTETHGRNGKVPLFFVGHSPHERVSLRKGKKQKPIFPCFSRGSPWSIELQLMR
jgi:hypothetical protein